MTNFIEPYNKNWKTEFGNLKKVLLKTLGNYTIDIQHVGSTAIPQLYAKPILDIDIIITNKAQLSEIAINLEKIGYKNRGEQGILGRFAFRQTSDLTPVSCDNKKWQEHHLYVCFSDSLALKNHLLFRNALLNDRRLAEEYSQLKMNLIKEKDMTREYYTTKKTDFIIAALTTIGFDENELKEITAANV